MFGVFMIWMSIFLLCVFSTQLILAEFSYEYGYEEKFDIYLWKPLSTLAVISLCIFSSFGNFYYGLIILGGLIFSMGGDVALMFKENKKYFTIGLVCFILAHLVYSFGFFYLNGFAIYFWPAFIIMGVVGAIIYFHLYSGLGNMKLKVLVYTTIICLMTGFALSSFGGINFHQALAISIGAVLFLISDIILAVATFKVAFKYNRISLAFYYSGQALIAMSGIWS